MSKSSKDQLDKMLEFCERSDSRVRFKLGDGDWQETAGPEMLRQLKGNRSGRLSIAHVTKVVGGDGN